MPTCEECNMNMCVHPDDPPIEILGLPRIVRTEEDIKWFLDAVPNKHNGLTFCAGSLSAGAYNNVVELAKKFASRTHFVHLRSCHIFPLRSPAFVPYLPKWRLYGGQPSGRTRRPHRAVQDFREGESRVADARGSRNDVYRRAWWCVRREQPRTQCRLHAARSYVCAGSGTRNPGYRRPRTGYRL